MNARILFPVATTVLVSALATGCASDAVDTYNTSGPQGALVSQSPGFDANICRYDTGLTIYTQGNCPPTVRTNVFTR